MNVQSATEFAKWLAQDQPELFVALYKRALPQTARAMGDFTDVLSSIGTGLANAASSVGNYLSSSQGTSQLMSLAGTYLQSKAAQSAVDINLQRAQMGVGPAPIQTVYNPSTGQYQAVLPQTNGSVVPINMTTRSALLPAGLPSWAPWAMGAGGLILLLLLWKR